MTTSNIFECSLESAPLLYTVALANNGADFYNFVKLWLNLHQNPMTPNELFHGLVGPAIEIHAEKYLLKILEAEGFVTKTATMWHMTEKMKNKPLIRFMPSTDSKKKSKSDQVKAQFILNLTHEIDHLIEDLQDFCRVKKCDF